MNFCHSLKSCCPWVFFPLLDVYCPWVFAHPLVFCCQWLFAHNFVDCCTWASFCQIGCCSPSLSFCRCSARQLVLAAMSFCPPLDICSPWVFAHHLMFAVHEFLICDHCVLDVNVHFKFTSTTQIQFASVNIALSGQHNTIFTLKKFKIVA